MITETKYVLICKKCDEMTQISKGAYEEVKNENNGFFGCQACGALTKGMFIVPPSHLDLNNIPEYIKEYLYENAYKLELCGEDTRILKGFLITEQRSKEFCLKNSKEKLADMILMQQDIIRKYEQDQQS